MHIDERDHQLRSAESDPISRPIRQLYQQPSGMLVYADRHNESTIAVQMWIIMIVLGFLVWYVAILTGVLNDVQTVVDAAQKIMELCFPHSGPGQTIEQKRCVSESRPCPRQAGTTAGVIVSGRTMHCVFFPLMGEEMKGLLSLHNSTDADRRRSLAGSQSAQCATRLCAIVED
jgi:hypothetical protein